MLSENMQGNKNPTNMNILQYYIHKFMADVDRNKNLVEPYILQLLSQQKPKYYSI